MPNRGKIMTLEAAQNLKNKMPWKQIYFDTVYNCHRLIDPRDFYEYWDTDKGKYRYRPNIASLVPIHSKQKD